jgi:hypothetical protein
MKMVYTCKSCQKEYKNKECFIRHENFCIFMNTSKREKEKELEEIDSIPSLFTLFNITKELLVKYDKLQKDHDNLKQLVYKRQKKINVIHWLNNNINNIEDFDIWYKNLVFNIDHLEFVFNLGNIDGLIEILNNLIIDKNIIPIKCFGEKENTFYVFNKNNNWKIMTNEETNQFIKYLNKKITNLFGIWQENNKHKLQDDKFAEEYILKMQKVIGKDIPFELQASKIKNKIYKFLKTNIKTLIEYDFT